MKNIQYLDANNLYGWAMSKKLPVNGFKWIETAEPVINKDFIKNYDENNDKGYIFEIAVKYQKDYTNYIVIYRSHLKEWK